MSTAIEAIFSQSDLDRCVDLRRFLDELRGGMGLLLPKHLGKRLNALDELEAIIGDLDPDAVEFLPEPELIKRAIALSSKFEAANELVYRATHAEIADLGTSAAMNHWLMELSTDGVAGRPHPGLSFDALDEFVSGVLQLQRAEEPIPFLSPEMTPYQPTPVRHILDLIAACKFSRADVLIDLGSGLGHVPLLVSVLTGIRTVGIEIQTAYVASAQVTARELNLTRVMFAPEDARVADLSNGTLFYMFSPFSGSILMDVLCQLHKQSQLRSIKICSLGPCTRMLQDQNWLRTTERPDIERITLFTSR